MSEDQVDDPGTSSEGATVAPEPTEPQGDLEPQDTSSDTGATVEPSEPEVNWQEKYQELEQSSRTGYRELQGQGDQDRAELARYRQTEANARAEVMADRDKWIDHISDPQKAGQFIDQMVAEKLQQRDGVMAAQQEHIAATNAFSELQNTATQAGITPTEWQSFVNKNSVNGVMFPGMPPGQALETAKDALVGAHREKFAAQVKESADKDAADKAKRILKNQVPSAASTGNKAAGHTDITDAILDDARAERETWK